MVFSEKKINNAFYDELDSAWYTGQDHPVALLRAEARLKNPWVIHTLRAHFSHLATTPRVISVLDLGCGGGLLSNSLAQEGFQTTGIDLSEQSLAVAKKYDVTQTVSYQHGDITALPFADEQFDATCCLDVLEHVEDPRTVVAEACRVLKPGGLFFFHTFNRTWFAKLLVIHGVEYFFKNVPKNMHVYSKFIKPQELASYCNQAHAQVIQSKGMEVVLTGKLILEILRTRLVPQEIQFRFCSSLKAGYVGIAQKIKK